MADSSYLQTNFLGGEWSDFAQGRTDHPKYRSAMNVAFNGYPIEEGAFARRPGYQFSATTRNGNPGRLLPFSFESDTPYAVEFTDGFVRVFNGPGLVFNADVVSVIGISTDNPAVVTVGPDASKWASGNEVQFLFSSGSATPYGEILRHRQFVVTFLAGSTTQFTIADPITGLGIDGATINWSPQWVQAQVARVLELPSPYTSGVWEDLRIVQAAAIGVQGSSIGLLLLGTVSPHTLVGAADPQGTQFAKFTLMPASFSDGPYLDPVPGSVALPVGISGSITLSIFYQQWDSTLAYNTGDSVTFGNKDYTSLQSSNLSQEPDISPTYWLQVPSGSAIGPNGFVSTDVGRLIRLFSEPLPWNDTTVYALGDVVSFSGAYYILIHTGPPGPTTPDNAPGNWALTTGAGAALWTWGTIAAVTAVNQVTLVINGDALLYDETAINTWQIGAYSNTTGWPTCGIYYEGRLWFGGVFPNRIDASNTNDFFNMSPTAPDGTVGDANGISEIFNSDDLSQVYWMQGSPQGLILGTLGGEWLAQASVLTDPLTPSSIQIHRVTKFKSADILPVQTPLTTVFVESSGKRLYELFPDVFSGKMAAPTMTTFANHISDVGIEEIAYQHAVTPIVWMRLADGSFAGSTYRRTSSFSNEEPTFVGFHRHALGSGQLVESICVTPSLDGTADILNMVSKNPTTGIYHVGTATPLFQVDDPITDSWFVDDAVTPSGLVTSLDGVTLYGLWHLNGTTASVVIVGLDCGDHSVSAGSMFVPFGSDPSGLFSAAYMAQHSGNDFGVFATPVDTFATVTPSAIATTGTVQILPTQASSNFICDFPNNRGFEISSTNVIMFNLSTGAITGSATISFLLSGQAQAGAWYGDGYLYFCVGGDNTSPIARVAVDGTFGTVPATIVFGIASTGFAASADGIGVPIDACIVQANDTTFFASVSLVDKVLTIVNVNDSSWAGHAFQVGDNAQCIAGAGGSGFGSINTLSGSGSAFTLYQTTLASTTAGLVDGQEGFFLTTITGTAGPYQANSPSIVFGSTTGATIDEFQVTGSWSNTRTYSAGQVVLYTNSVTNPVTGLAYPQYFFSLANGNIDLTPLVGDNLSPSWGAVPFNNPLVSTTEVGNFVPADVDPTWSTFNDVNTMFLDQTDGNIILTVDTMDPVTGNKHYAVKLSATTAKVLWKVPLPSTAMSTYGTNCQLGTASFLSGSGSFTTAQVVVVQTKAGTFTSFPVLGVGEAGSAFSDDITGRIVAFGQYTKGAGTPVQATVATPTSFTNQWFVLQIGNDFVGDTVSSSRLTIPAVVGYTYTTQGQLLRPTIPEQIQLPTAGTGLTRRHHMFSALVAGAAQGIISVGTHFDDLRVVTFKTKGQQPIATDVLFSGVHWNTIDDVYDFDGMLAFQISRPLPATIVSLTGFINTQGR